MDYPEPQRSEVLDFLFKPNFGASLHHLKVEIGGDVNSTDGTEPSHARTREEFEHPRPAYYQRGYEWWIMREANRRNPQILLDVLQWGAPAWIGGGNFWSQDNADFIAAFIHGAKRYHGLDIDFCGLWNERPHNTAWIKLLRNTLDARGSRNSRSLRPTSATARRMWNIGKEVLADREFAGAIYAIGAHYPHSHSTPECVRTNKPLFASEDGPWRGDWLGACTLAKTYNRNYIVGKMTKTVIWSLISSYYDILPLPNSGPMKALEPWSGHYEVQPAIWAIAHTTQFTQPGWKYLDSGCGTLKSGGSYVTLRSPGDRGDYSIIAETVDARSTQTIVFRVSGGLSAGPLHVWRTNERSQFEQLADVALAGSAVRITLEPGSIYSFTTTTGQHRGQTAVPPAADFPLPYTRRLRVLRTGQVCEVFFGPGRRVRGGPARRRPWPVPAASRGQEGDRVAAHARAVYDPRVEDLAELRGVRRCPDRRPWRCVAFRPSVGRCPECGAAPRLSFDDRCRRPLDALGRQDRARRRPRDLRSEKMAQAETHPVQDRRSPRILTGPTSARPSTSRTSSGMAGLGSGWNCAEFDNFAFGPSRRPRLVNLAHGKKARASSQWSDEYAAARAFDGDGNTRWNAAAGKTAGEWLEVDFGRRLRFNLVSVRQFDTRIARYRIQVADGDCVAGCGIGRRDGTFELGQSVRTDRGRRVTVTDRQHAGEQSRERHAVDL